MLGAGLGGYFLQKNHSIEIPHVKETQEQAEVRTDEFSLFLFRHIIAEKQRGNVLVAPHMLTKALLALQDIAAGQTLKELQSLKLATGPWNRPSEPESAALLAMDYNLEKGEKSVGVMPLPFSDNVPMALSLFNGMLAPITGKADAQIADSTMVSNRTRLLAACASHYTPELLFFSGNSRVSDFDNASGGMPHFQQMRSRGLYVTVTSDDGSWRAVAIPTIPGHSDKNSFVCIAILPSGTARDFAANLSAELLTSIRKKLATTPPQDTLIEFPRLELQVLPHDMRDSLRRMGLKALFDSETADFTPLTPDKVQLGAFIQSFSVSLKDSTSNGRINNSLEDAANVITFNRPFIWLICDLHTDAPIEFIGLIEEM